MKTELACRIHVLQTFKGRITAAGNMFTNRSEPSVEADDRTARVKRYDERIKS